MNKKRIRNVKEYLRRYITSPEPPNDIDQRFVGYRFAWYSDEEEDRMRDPREHWVSKEELAKWRS